VYNSIKTSTLNYIC